jgi:FkbM family methyltransferase
MVGRHRAVEPQFDYVPRCSDDQPYATITVAAVSLDTYAKQQGLSRYFVKIETERAELKVIDGLGRTVLR